MLPIKAVRFGFIVNKQHRKFFIEIIQAVNVLVITALSVVIWIHFYRETTLPTLDWRNIAVLAIMFAAVYVAFGRTYSAFTIDIPRISEIIYSQFLAEVFTDLIVYLATFLQAHSVPALWPLLLLLVFQLMMTVAWAYFAHHVFFKLVRPVKTIVIWDARESLDNLISTYGLNIRFEIVKSFHISELQDGLSVINDDLGAVILCGIHSHDRNQIAKICVEKGIRLYSIPRIGDVIMSGATNIQMLHLPMMVLERYNPSPFYLAAKRIFDILFSSATLVILSPLMIVVALLIRRDGGTVFFHQTRLTKDGKQFEILKFRSMRMNAESDGVARLSTGEKDERITPVGSVIRRYRIDELPQLVNILRGEMTVVGPRPERPEIAERYCESMPEFSLRLQAKAGLTGRAQVFGKYNSSPYDKLLMDLQYIASASIATDLNIIFATVKTVFIPESTEGVSEDHVNAAF